MARYQVKEVLLAGLRAVGQLNQEWVEAQNQLMICEKEVFLSQLVQGMKCFGLNLGEGPLETWNQ